MQQCSADDFHFVIHGVIRGRQAALDAGAIAPLTALLPDGSSESDLAKASAIAASLALGQVSTINDSIYWMSSCGRHIHCSIITSSWMHSPPIFSWHRTFCGTRYVSCGQSVCTLSCAVHANQQCLPVGKTGVVSERWCDICGCCRGRGACCVGGAAEPEGRRSAQRQCQVRRLCRASTMP
jgi:hypothetical protein